MKKQAARWGCEPQGDTREASKVEQQHDQMAAINQT